jgi:hypothetical protein
VIGAAGSRPKRRATMWSMRLSQRDTPDQPFSRTWVWMGPGCEWCWWGRLCCTREREPWDEQSGAQVDGKGRWEWWSASAPPGGLGDRRRRCCGLVAGVRCVGPDRRGRCWVSSRKSRVFANWRYAAAGTEAAPFAFRVSVGHTVAHGQGRRDLPDDSVAQRPAALTPARGGVLAVSRGVWPLLLTASFAVASRLAAGLAEGPRECFTGEIGIEVFRHFTTGSISPPSCERVNAARRAPPRTLPHREP